MDFSLVVASGDCSLVAVLGPLILAAFLVAEHGLSGPKASVFVAPGLQSTGIVALILAAFLVAEHGLSGPKASVFVAPGLQSTGIVALRLSSSC